MKSKLNPNTKQKMDNSKNLTMLIIIAMFGSANAQNWSICNIEEMGFECSFLLFPRGKGKERTRYRVNKYEIA